MNRPSPTRDRPTIEEEWNTERTHREEKSKFTFLSSNISIAKSTSVICNHKSIFKGRLEFEEHPVTRVECNWVDSIDQDKKKTEKTEKELLEEGYRERRERDKEINSLWKDASQEADKRLISNE